MANNEPPLESKPIEVDESMEETKNSSRLSQDKEKLASEWGNSCSWNDNKTTYVKNPSKSKK
jgi:hypothetical protein